jgi:hypothetical protein
MISGQITLNELHCQLNNLHKDTNPELTGYLYAACCSSKWSNPRRVVPLRKELSQSREGKSTRDGTGLKSCYNTNEFSASK